MKEEVRVFLSENKISQSVLENIIKHRFNSDISIYRHDENLVIVVSKYHDYSSGGGVARDSILTVFFKEQVQEKEWRYSDKWSYQKDRWDLMLREVQKVLIDYQDSQIVLTIECLGAVNYPNRTIKFYFSN
jgi:hypothetical protein